jgi:DNA modification methylase
LSGEVSNSKRFVSITGGNLRNQHLYITGYHDFFPQECYGESSARKGTGRELTLLVDGLSSPVETDIAKSSGNGRPRSFFRKRAWVARFFQQHDLRQGDMVAIERLDRLTYRVYPSGGRTIGHPAAGKPGSSVPGQATLFPKDQGAGNGRTGKSGFGDTAFTKNRSEPLHRWVPWIAGFSGAFVEEVLKSAALADPSTVTILDPFAGVGTTLVEGMMRGYNVVGFDINPYAVLASDLKISCARHRVKPLTEALNSLEGLSRQRSGRKAQPKSEPPSGFRTRIPFFSPRVERDVLLLQDFIEKQKNVLVRKALKVALGAVMVGFSNYSYEPSLSTRAAAGKSPIEDADVFGIFRDKVRDIEADIRFLQRHMKSFQHHPETKVYERSYLQDADVLSDASIDVLVTSPPYLNNYHYVRNTRPQLYWLGLTEGNGRLKKLENDNFGCFWQTVRGGPSIELSFDLPELRGVLEAIRERHPEKGVYGGGGWANYAAKYFNDCYTFFDVTKRVMKPNGLVVIVIGNNIVQGVHIETERFLAEIAALHGFQLQEMHIVRKKRTGSSIVNSSVRVGATKQRVELNETAVELRAPG